MEGKNQIGSYQLIKLIGQGAFACVYQVSKGMKIYALKAIKKTILIEMAFLETYIKQEAETMKQIQNEHVVQLIENFEDSEHFYMVMEYCESNLATLINCNEKFLSEEEAGNYFIQILDGMRAIHEKQFIHRDLKLENILVKEEQLTKSQTLKICDFGFSKPLSQQNLTQTYCGTDEYMAPEIQEQGDYNFKVDIWSLGVILYYLVFKVFPFTMRYRSSPNKEFDLKKALEGKTKQQQVQISEELKDLFKKIFVHKYQNRIDFKQIYEHPFLKKFQNQQNSLQNSMLDSIKFYTQEFNQNQQKIQEKVQEQINKDKKLSKIINTKLPSIQEEQHSQISQSPLSYITPNLEEKKKNSEDNIDELDDIPDEGGINKIDQIQFSQTPGQILLKYQQEVADLKRKLEAHSIITQSHMKSKLRDTSSFMKMSQIKSSQTYQKEKQFQQQLDTFEYENNKYQFMQDTVQQMKSYSIVGINLDIICYYLEKVRCFYYIQILKNLQSNINQFNVPQWDSFFNSNSFKYVVKLFEDNVKNSQNQLYQYYNKSMEQTIQDKKILDGITEKVQESNFEDIKLPFRLTMNNFLNYLQQLEDLSSPGDIMLKTNFSQLRMRILICICINHIFDTEVANQCFKIFIQSSDNKKFTFTEFLTWCQQTSIEQSKQIIDAITVTVFSGKK